ncbi:hypothetical protein EHH60_01890 [Bradyrhizobium sp. RP6]|nr:hypothetical protein EHH60_01890 [Bradyrhizobium sp. RP6]
MIRAPAGDGSSLACLGQVVLKFHGLVRLRRFGDRVLHRRRSWYIKWIKVLRVHVASRSR